MKRLFSILALTVSFAALAMEPPIVQQLSGQLQSLQQRLTDLNSILHSLTNSSPGPFVAPPPTLPHHRPTTDSTAQPHSSQLHSPHDHQAPSPFHHHSPPHSPKIKHHNPSSSESNTSSVSGLASKLQVHLDSNTPKKTTLKIPKTGSAKSFNKQKEPVPTITIQMKQQLNVAMQTFYAKTKSSHDQRFKRAQAEGVINGIYKFIVTKPSKASELKEEIKDYTNKLLQENPMLISTAISIFDALKFDDKYIYEIIEKTYKETVEIVKNIVNRSIQNMQNSKSYDLTAGEYQDLEEALSIPDYINLKVLRAETLIKTGQDQDHTHNKFISKINSTRDWLINLLTNYNTEYKKKTTHSESAQATQQIIQDALNEIESEKIAEKIYCIMAVSNTPEKFTPFNTDFENIRESIYQYRREGHDWNHNYKTRYLLRALKKLEQTLIYTKECGICFANATFDLYHKHGSFDPFDKLSDDLKQIGLDENNSTIHNLGKTTLPLILKKMHDLIENYSKYLRPDGLNRGEHTHINEGTIRKSIEQTKMWDAMEKNITNWF